MISHPAVVLSRDIWEATTKRHLGLVSAGVAFFTMLAIFPAVAALISVFGYVADPTVISSQMELLEEFVPDEAFDLLNAQVVRLVTANDSTLGWASVLSTLLAFWSARRGVGALVQGLNAIYGTELRGGVRHSLVVLFLTFAMIMVGFSALALQVVLPVGMAFFPLGGFYGILIEVLRWALAVAVLVAGLGLFYRFGPNRNGTQRTVQLGVLSPGLIVAVLLWAAASVAFSFFLQNFGNYNEVYGSIGAVIALLMWFYISAYVVLLGGVLNAVMETRIAARLAAAGAEADIDAGSPPQSDTGNSIR